MTTASAPTPVFPCRQVPEDAGAARLLGLYAQRQEGQLMQRVRVPGGRLQPRQWRALAAVARELTPGTPLHLTTRQDVEIHDLGPRHVPAAQVALAEAGLSCVGACGDTLRNITVCPGSGLCRGAADLLPLARAVHEALSAVEGLFAMPRKFKISFSACPRSCARPWINDLGFVATDGGLEVIGAGSLGAKPGCGTRLAERIAPGEAPAFATAAVRLFIDHGDREHRTRARLRHVRQRLGDAEFLTLLADYRGREPAAGKQDLDLTPAGEGLDERALCWSDGDVPTEAADALAEVAELPDVHVRIAVDHRVMLYGRSAELARAVESRPSLHEAGQARGHVVACPGKHWCARALVDTRGLAGRIRDELGPALAGKSVCISGCPNNCGHSPVADVGLTGRVATVNGRRQEAFDLFLDGDNGRSDRLATSAATRLSADEVVAKLAAFQPPAR